MSARKRVALIAHDNRKADMLEWARYNRETLAVHELYATGTTGALITEELGLSVTLFLSGPLGGDQQVGSRDRRGPDRLRRLLLGSARAATARRRREGIAPDRRRLQRADGLQSRDGGLHPLEPLDGHRVPARSRRGLSRAVLRCGATGRANTSIRIENIRYDRGLMARVLPLVACCEPIARPTLSDSQAVELGDALQGARRPPSREDHQHAGAAQVARRSASATSPSLSASSSRPSRTT